MSTSSATTDLLELAKQADEYASFMSNACGGTMLPHEFKRIRDERFARLVHNAALERAAKAVEEEPCDCCWPDGSEPISAELAATIRALKEPEK